MPLTQVQEPAYDLNPAVSPDGNQIVFSSTREGSADLWLLDIAGGDPDPKQLTFLPGLEEFPSWSPDGSRIAFLSTQEGEADVWIINADGSNSRPFVQGPGNEGWAVWSVDGSRLYYASKASGQYEIWMRSQEGTVTQVTYLGSARGGLPMVDTLTKFAVGRDALIVPVETRRAEIWMLERPQPLR